jgi:hypothetical protein
MQQWCLTSLPAVKGAEHARRPIGGAGPPRTNLALNYSDAGRTGEANTLPEQTPAAQERILGPTTPTPLASRHTLASAYRDAGRTGEARDLNRRPLDPQECRTETTTCRDAGPKVSCQLQAARALSQVTHCIGCEVNPPCAPADLDRAG